MSTQHQHIVSEMARQYESLQGAITIGPSALAFKVMEKFRSDDPIEAHIQYASLEHMKSMARAFLAKRNDPTADDNEIYDQSSFEFSGQLQVRYPLPRKRGEDPVYKLREHLTAEERAWNVDQLRKSARSRQEHADALEAEGMSQAKKAA